MKKYRNAGSRVPILFSPETRFNVAPQVTFRAVEQTRFEQLKEQLLVEKMDELVDPVLNSALRRAANEAAALAWVTQVPFLVFPTLFEEKTSEALNRLERQEQIMRRTRGLLAV